MSSRKTDPWGRVTIDPEQAFSLAYQGIDVWSLPTEPNQIVEKFNQLCDRFGKTEMQIGYLSIPENTPEEEHALRADTWLISDEIRAITVREFILDLCARDEERARVNFEMDLYEERNLIPLLQLMMYLVDHFRQNGIVWGVGRGSSVASYVLFKIGVHKIDSIKYGLDIGEFLK